MRSITGLRRAMAIPVPHARPLHPAHYRARDGARPEAPLSAQFQAMPGAAPQSGPASALFAARYVGGWPAVRASVIEGNDGWLLKGWPRPETGSAKRDISQGDNYEK